MKDKIKKIVVVISLMVITGVFSVTASTIINSKDIIYSTDKTGLSANVQDAIDETYTKAVSLSDRITTLENSSSSNILDTIYPVGSIYITTADKTIEEVAARLGGEWEKYAKGTTLIGDDGSTYVTNDSSKGSGGSSVVTLSEENLPNHTHTGETTSTGAHTHSTTAKTVTISSGLTAQSAGAHTHTYDKGSTALAQSGGFPTSTGTSFNYSNTTSTSSSAGAHTHSVTGSITVPALSIASSGTHNHNVSVSTCTNCTGTAFSTQDPYIVVYMYRRIN